MLLPRELPGGLILRQAAPADADELAAFNARIHEEPGLDATTRDLMSAAHPTTGAERFTVVTDPATGGKIVSSLCLIPQTWAYAGIPFGVGRPELVGTDPAYRRRGLVRAQMDVAHAWSAALGHTVQAITGMRWYYRQFGYEYALDLGGGRFCPLAAIPPAPDGPEPYRLRPMSADDLPFAQALYNAACAEARVTCPRSPADWLYELHGRPEASLSRLAHSIVETPAGEPAGLLATSPEVFDQSLLILLCLSVPGYSLRAWLPSAMRALRPRAEDLARALGRSISHFYFNLGRAHPAFEALAGLPVRVRPPYAWYLRLPDLPGFMQHVAPALEARLAQSVMAGHTGALRVSTFTGGFQLDFERGRLCQARAWDPFAAEEAQAYFPPGVFLKLLFGYRSLEELRLAFPDCAAEGDAGLLLEALFPPQPSFVHALG